MDTISLQAIVRVQTGKQRGMGVLLNPSTVLTCAHVLNDAPNTSIKVQQYPKPTTTKAVAVHETHHIRYTDLAVLHLETGIQLPQYPRLSKRIPLPLQRLEMRTQDHELVGRVLSPWPAMVTRNLQTVAFPGAWAVYNRRAIKGDSGTPIFHNGEIIGVQSMILDPWNLNLGIATMALTAPHLRAINQAIHQGQQHHDE